MLPLTTAGVAAVRRPRRWRLWTLRAGPEPAVSVWLNVTRTGLVRGAERALATGLMLVMVGAWARASPGVRVRASPASSTRTGRATTAPHCKKVRSVVIKGDEDGPKGSSDLLPDPEQDVTSVVS